ncbi:Hypothetical protein A7982_02657 [Minicystis rosea]|nr:Hypothetical protein A7982_02657 [Minicystis rosea]
MKGSRVRANHRRRRRRGTSSVAESDGAMAGRPDDRPRRAAWLRKARISRHGRLHFHEALSGLAQRARAD